MYVKKILNQFSFCISVVHTNKVYGNFFISEINFGGSFLPASSNVDFSTFCRLQNCVQMQTLYLHRYLCIEMGKPLTLRLLICAKG